MSRCRAGLLCALLLALVSTAAAERYLRKVANNNNLSGTVQPTPQQTQQPVYQQQQQASYPQQQQQQPVYPQQQPVYPQQQPVYPQQQQQQQPNYPQQQPANYPQQLQPQQYQLNHPQQPQYLTFPEQHGSPMMQQQYPVPAASNNWNYNEYQQQRVQDLQAQQAQNFPQPLSGPAGPPTEDEWTRQVDAIISRGVLQLSLSLASAVEQDGLLSGQAANVVFSPINVAAALALVLAGSNGTTFQEIANVLGIATGVSVLENRERVHTEFGRFLRELETQSTMVRGNASAANQLVFANGLFVQRGFEIQPHFEKIAQSYRSEVIHVEFAREPGITKDKINSWFAEHTMGRIRSVLSGAPPTDTRLMIASALFFNGAWEAPFPIEATMTRPFYGVSANGSKEAYAVYMMTNNMELPMVVDHALGCRLLELPYRGREVSMYLVLPDVQGLEGLRDLESRLTADVLERLIQSRKEAPVIYSLPRMKLERSISLRTALEALGVRSLFDARLADLSHLSHAVLERVDNASTPTPATPAASNPASTTTTKPAFPTTPSASAASTPATPAQPTKKPTAAAGAPGGAKAPGSVGDNTIGSDLYFSSRNKVPGEAGKANGTATPAGPEVVERWGPQQQHTARLYVDDVLHKVEVDVTETGTVASAATAITINRDGSTHVLRFNRPFLFFIRHNPTGLVLFYGTVVRPMPEWIVAGVDVNQLIASRPVRPGNRQPPPVPQPPQQARPGQAATPSRRPLPQHHRERNTPPQATPSPALATPQPARTSANG